MTSKVLITPIKFFLLLPILAETYLQPSPLPRALQDSVEKAEAALEMGLIEDARHQAESLLANPATAAAAHELLGRIAFEQQRDEEAVSHFQAAKASGRFTIAMGKDWSSALVNLGRRREACEIMEKALALDASLFGLRYQLAGTYMALGDPRGALPHLERLYRQGVRHSGIATLLARARFSAGQDELAVELLESSVPTTSSPTVLLEFGRLLFERAYYSQALSPLKKAWRLRPGSYEVGMYLALCHYMIGQYDESGNVLTAINPEPPPPLDYRILLGSVYARLGRRDDARHELEAATRQAPVRADGYLNLGLFYLEQKDHARAMEMLDKGSRLMEKGTKLIYLIPARVNCDGLAPPRVVDNGERARAESYSQLGRALEAKEQLGSALELYLLALEVDSRSPAAYAGIGKTCWELGSLKTAQEYLKKGLELYPGEAELHYNRGLVYEWMNQTEEAFRSFSKAIELAGPNTPALYWVELGRAQLGGGRLDDAEASFQKGLACDRNFGVAHYELGKLYFRRKEYERAEQCFEKALELDPTLLGAYYEYGLACLRRGEADKGKVLIETFNRKQALRSDMKVIPLRR